MMRSIFFYIVVIGIASGILFRSFFDIGIPEIVLTILIGFALGCAWRMKVRTYESVLFMSSLFCIACAVGMIRLHAEDSTVSQLQEYVGETSTFTGVVVREPDARTSSLHLYIREERTGALFLAFADPFEKVAYGDRVSVEGELTLPETFETETGRVFDYVGFLKARGVHEVIYRASVDVLGSEEGNSILSRLLMLKHGFMEVIERSIPEPALGLGEGVLLGVKRALGEDLEEVFRTVGIIHIVVLSGYNIMIVAESVMRFLGLFFFPRTRLLLGLLTILLFALMVGLSATVVRASIMAGLVLVARAMGRGYAVLRALALAGIGMLFVNPYLLAFDPGFQLSFLATVGLVLLSPELEIRMPKVPEMLGLRGYLATTLGTQLFVLPLLLFSMGTLSLVSVIANVLVLPFVPIAMFVTFLTGVVGSVVPFLGTLIGFVANLVLSYIIVVAEFLSTIPFASVTIPIFPWWGMVMLFSLIAGFTLFLRERRAFETESALDDYADWTIDVIPEAPHETKSLVGR